VQRDVAGGVAGVARLEELPATRLGAEVTGRRRPQSEAERWGGENGGGLEEEQRAVVATSFYSSATPRASGHGRLPLGVRTTVGYVAVIHGGIGLGTNTQKSGRGARLLWSVSERRRRLGALAPARVGVEASAC
jgi:hypothetical protein